jgi:hypothetical protein
MNRKKEGAMKREIVNHGNDGYLRLKRTDCPYHNTDDYCGDWCPHFHYDAKAHTLSITCSGMYVSVMLEDKTKAIS